MRRVRVLAIVAVCGLALVLAGCGLLTPHAVSAPDTPAGPTSGHIGETLTYSTGGASCSKGHSVEYRFDWGDGTYSSWDPSTSASNSWDTKDTHAVRVQARCATDTSVVSDWSWPEAVTVTVIGATRDNDRLAITLQGVRTASAIGSGVSRREPADGHVFLIVDVRAEALRDGVAVVAESFTVVQADGQAHQRSGVTAALNEKRLDSRAGMFTGDSASGELAFEVCAAQEHYTLEYNPTIGDPIKFRFSLQHVL